MSDLLSVSQSHQTKRYPKTTLDSPPSWGLPCFKTTPSKDIAIGNQTEKPHVSRPTRSNDSLLRASAVALASPSRASSRTQRASFGPFGPNGNELGRDHPSDTNCWGQFLDVLRGNRFMSRRTGRTLSRQELTGREWFWEET